jgi:hypothetical protein
MKKLIFPLTIMILIAIGCKNEKPADFTVLDDFTLYDVIPDKMNGKVEKVIEKYYWAIPDGETYKKGDLMTMAERDSLGWDNDFEAVYDKAGDLVHFITMDENGKTLSKYEIIKENNVIVKGKYYENDTIRYYDNFRADDKGKMVGLTRFSAIADTVMRTLSKKVNSKGDTIVYDWTTFNGKPGDMYMQIFNDLGQNVRIVGDNRENNFPWVGEIKYNDKGKESELLFFGGKDKHLMWSIKCTSYEYDEYKNWVKQTYLCPSKEHPNRVAILERTYTYFE